MREPLICETKINKNNLASSVLAERSLQNLDFACELHLTGYKPLSARRHISLYAFSRFTVFAR